MKNTLKKLLLVALCALTALCVCFTAVGCKNDDKTITVCASATPHAEILNDIVKSELEKKGYKLEVKVLDWTEQNDAVANGDYDANYFQHVPYLNLYSGKTALFAACKVHYEPLGIYYGKAAVGTALTDGKTFEVCDDESNAVRAFNLLAAKGVISREAEGDNYPVTESGDKLAISETAKTWKSKDGKIEIKLVAENLLVSSMSDYDFALLPCNTAYTGNVGADKRAAVEDDAAEVSGKANVIAARADDYKNDAAYKARIDALADVMLSKAVTDYVAEKYNGIITCSDQTQIDLRPELK